MDLRQGDCLELMKSIPDKSIDLMICDLPYGETNCKWDTKIDLTAFWKEFKRIRKDNKVPCIHFCSTKFGYNLIQSWEKGYKMDLVWKKRNKTGGLQSRYRPMRNHEMIYFFYDSAPRYNRDKYHKRIQPKKVHDVPSTDGVYGTHSSKIEKDPKYFDPPNPVSVVEEEDTIYGIDKKKAQNSGRKDFKGIGTQNAFEPPNPASVVEEEDTIYGETKEERHQRYLKSGTGAFEPPNPSSVVEEDWKIDESGYGYKTGGKYNFGTYGYTPKQPCSVVEEKQGYYGNLEKGNKDPLGMDASYKKHSFSAEFHPPNPASVIEDNELDVFDYIENPEEAPFSVVESNKVFIGKRNHQTEKPQDVLEFLIKYWSNEDSTILDPTMGSGSTGVACKKLGRKFIGFELDEKIFKTAKNRIEK